MTILIVSVPRERFKRRSASTRCRSHNRLHAATPNFRGALATAIEQGGRAAKVLNPDPASNGPARLRFLREARSAAAVTHDHVVTIHAVDDSGEVPFLAMEYVEGESLEEHIRQNGLLWLEEIVRIGMRAASGLAAAHALGLVHRDIKPSNILLENCITRVKVAKFTRVQDMRSDLSHHTDQNT